MQLEVLGWLFGKCCTNEWNPQWPTSVRSWRGCLVFGLGEWCGFSRTQWSDYLCDRQAVLRQTAFIFYVFMLFWGVFFDLKGNLIWLVFVLFVLQVSFAMQGHQVTVSGSKALHWTLFSSDVKSSNLTVLTSAVFEWRWKSHSKSFIPGFLSVACWVSLVVIRECDFLFYSVLKENKLLLASPNRDNIGLSWKDVKSEQHTHTHTRNGLV